MLWNTSQMQPRSMTKAAIPERAVRMSGEDLMEGVANRLMISAAPPTHKPADLGPPCPGPGSLASANRLND